MPSVCNWRESTGFAIIIMEFLIVFIFICIELKLWYNIIITLARHWNTNSELLMSVYCRPSLTNTGCLKIKFTNNLEKISLNCNFGSGCSLVMKFLPVFYYDKNITHLIFVQKFWKWPFPNNFCKIGFLHISLFFNSGCDWSLGMKFLQVVYQYRSITWYNSKIFWGKNFGKWLFPSDNIDFES